MAAPPVPAATVAAAMCPALTVVEHDARSLIDGPGVQRPHLSVTVGVQNFTQSPQKPSRPSAPRPHPGVVRVKDLAIGGKASVRTDAHARLPRKAIAGGDDSTKASSYALDNSIAGATS